jgi:hypothetical protein
VNLNPFLDALQFLSLMSAIDDVEHWFDQINPGFRVAFRTPPAGQAGFGIVDFARIKAQQNAPFGAYLVL